MTTSTHNNVIQLPLANKLPPVSDLVIDGVEKVRVNETRTAYLSQQATTNKPAGTRKLAEKAQARNKQTKAPETGFRLLETADASLGMLMAAKSVSAGLKSGETVVLVSPDQPEQIIRKLEMTGLKVASAVKTGKLIIFSSQPAISGNVSLSTNYRDVFGELFDLANAPVDRMIIMGMDLLVNLESQYLAYASVSKFSQAADEAGCKVIAQYSRNHSEAYDRLDAACSSLVNNYFVMNRGKKSKGYQLQPKNIASM